MHARAKRRHHGRLRPLTNAERAKRQERRERLNVERELRKMAARLLPVPVAAPRRRRLTSDWFARRAKRLGR